MSHQFFLSLIAVAILIFYLRPGSAETDPGVDRASAFVVGQAEDGEEFGRIEGPLLLGLAGAGMVGVVAGLLLVRRENRRSRLLMEEVEQRLSEIGKELQ